MLFNCLIFLTLFCSVLAELNYFDTNCKKFIDNNLCVQYKWNYPTCVPWDTKKCEIDLTHRKYCTVYLCKVIFIIFAYL